MKYNYIKYNYDVLYFFCFFVFLNYSYTYIYYGDILFP